MYLIIPPKYSVSYAVGLIKSKSSSWLKKKNKKIPQGSFCCRGYFVSTVGVNEFAIKTYLRDQDKKRVDKLKLGFW
ncbi:hypothetical protein COX11_00850 [Candidatus Berkelbacteria bacterium CG23_combo_of_CG06-09_8_20_14_all_41_73]|uniref:Transposase IS200-like domain-containing protein n=2 Tax=Candidatus Berkelbacteria TaxID=1618330 RepID=A0A2H0B037_9BACT|nr:MAG: hypothetical protein COX11_00850 [Candidatus Berkelbacteria bacterium CG23_combo_of_CG06-09_8_20_14_all_41_73]PIR27475.1 MAG: hypothetical protein COV40_00555 [Candidatus Berkelbacteria bacterium CG11_big_fil_rev_8_21_14_0_20_42_15]